MKNDNRWQLHRSCKYLARNLGKSYFADLRMTFRQKNFLQDWFRNKLEVGLG
jgi:hypothetical protein